MADPQGIGMWETEEGPPGFLVVRPSLHRKAGVRGGDSWASTGDEQGPGATLAVSVEGWGLRTHPWCPEVVWGSRACWGRQDTPAAP